MKPNEKAKDLMNKFIDYADDSMASLTDNARNCALLCVDEIITESTHFGDDTYFWERLEYWKEVKNQINQM